MNRTQLADVVARTAQLSDFQAQQAVAATLEAIAGALAAGDAVTLSGFGTFEVRDRAARIGRNPQNGEPIEIAASRVAAFKPATALKRAVATG